jgi:K(+)-stimulated pyrophosphate-energized sodium pump
LLAVELAILMTDRSRLIWAAILFAGAVVFVYRSFYSMRIESREPTSGNGGRSVTTNRDEVIEEPSQVRRRVLEPR